MIIQNFVPGGTTSVSATTSTGNARLATPNPSAVMVYNAGEVIAFIRAGKSNVAATASDFPVPAGAVMTLDLTASAGSKEVTHIAAITASSTATVYATCGDGN